LSSGKRVRLFLDSNVLTAGIVSTWGLDKAVLSLCAARICRLVLAEAVREEVEENLLIHLGGIESGDANRLLDHYGRLIELMKPEIVPYPSPADVRAARDLIRRASDVPVLLSAIASRPDWLLTHNTKHFTLAVAHRTGLRIATPVEFFSALSKSVTDEGKR
jgi:predicted nucleic acid-binding protein